MSTTTPATADLHIVVGYDGSPPAGRALDAAVGLLRGRTGRIEVVYVAHLSSTAMLSSGAVAEIEAGFDQIEQELRTAAQEWLRGRQESWEFQRRQGMITDQLIAVANDLRDAHAGDIVVIIVGSSSQAMHRAVGSVAVSLARHSPVPPRDRALDGVSLLSCSFALPSSAAEPAPWSLGGTRAVNLALASAGQVARRCCMPDPQPQAAPPIKPASEPSPLAA